ncbi:hypothetical protein ATO6_12310 [Oceanicola sp. 22II-s10i]|uniref:hypothetical protein n=1 Tax=Oceanicola sp. 22II-s10i TaxID=1317116 RepID=UPI000B525405|nr:hypothetical protein [Oceanicola sp. 22II-s10i]OWU84469.1 hypothetical protein ATO6_12310 [Oceanicola sp. 22II-s10i]
MPRKQNPTIQLPRERLEQLRQLSLGMPDTTMSAVIGELLNLARREGLIGHDIPGVTINALSDGIAIRFEDGPTSGFSFEEAAGIAETIRKFVAGDRPKGGVMIFAASHKSVFHIVGKGQGIEVKTISGSREGSKILTRDLTMELAEVLDRVVTQSMNTAE